MGHLLCSYHIDMLTDITAFDDGIHRFGGACWQRQAAAPERLGGALVGQAVAAAGRVQTAAAGGLPAAAAGPDGGDVPNHTSYFDILLLSGFVPRPFKYLSKSEILDIPVVGTGMRLAKHVFLKRNDIRSTIEVADTCVQRLQDGNSMVLFAEGTRSLDGTLKKFKKGAFQMAKAAGVPVVPVSIGNLHRWMPPFSILPLAPIRHTYIKVHPAIDTTNKSVREIKKLCFEAVNSGLPQ
eukprot:CAMPEP_0170107004 /NCGR_PEP_ID=MMETSP0020_2-20130122/5724_1 /TAXON_ID=98059 /ORGANISM="Dinobryon sp., Strain UTEXLB2267" /LENGTH=237 /DNA_ID=CAMNT_0010331465 /DNA_START=280 /DNA_END=991 /DNA_ORIENTATION=-